MIFWVLGEVECDPFRIFVRMLIAREVSVSFDPGENSVKVGVVKKVPNIVLPKSEAISV